MSNIAPLASIAASGPRIDALIARHIDLFFRRAMRGSGVTIEPRFVRLVTGEPHPFGNLALPADATDLAALGEAIAPLVACAAPAAVLFTTPVPPAADARLRDAGFVPHEGMPLMGVDIDRLPETPLPPGYRLVRCAAGATGDRWCEAFADGYELPRRVGACFNPTRAENVDAHDSPLQYFAIQKGDALVATSLLMLDRGVAGVYCVATLPAERGKGLGAHVTAEPLRQNRELNYRVGVLQSSEAGRPVYQRLGFAEFGEIPLYVRLPG